MRDVYRIGFVFLITIFFIFGATLAFAEDRDDDSGAAGLKTKKAEETKAAVEEEEDAPTAVKMVPKEEYRKIPAGWMIIQGRYGMSSAGQGGSFYFDEIPETSDASKTSDFSAPIGWMQVSGVDLLFFPTSGRRFMLSVSGEHQAGTFALDIEDDEDNYAYEIGLDSRTVQYYQSTLMFGLGYRWLRGSKFQHCASLYGKFGFGSAGMVIDGFANSWGGSGVFELGTNYMYRFSNRMHMGVQLDLRTNVAYFDKIEIDNGDNEMDVSVGGFMGVLSAIIGWEIL